jgi:hypothetical protein
MKIFLGPYKNFIGPYQIAEGILFWKNRDSDIVEKLGDWLATNKDGTDSALYRLCRWVDTFKERKINIRIDDYDIWSMDHTLAMIIVPMLKELSKNKHGAPFIDDEDVPLEFQSISAPVLSEEQKNTGDTDENWFPRWEWVLNEMIWTFEQHSSNWEEQYYSGESDLRFDDGVMKKGPKDTFTVDEKGVAAHRERMKNGRRLFAKYYEALWD